MDYFGTSKKKLNYFLKIVKDVLFPIHCLGCSEEGVWICDECRRELDTSGLFICPICDVLTEKGKVCSDCKDISYLDKQVWVLEYQKDGLSGEAIEKFKYEYVEDLANCFVVIIKDFLSLYNSIFPKEAIIAPVPLHKKRFAERSFNQANVLANILSDALGLRLKSDYLVRTKNTSSQAKLDRKERRDNVKGAFSLNLENDLKPKQVILVDDVYTTGSTMQECAKVLKQGGVEKVVGFTLARGDIDRKALFG